MAMRNRSPKGYSAAKARRFAPDAADAVAIGEAYQDYSDRVAALKKFQAAAGLTDDGLYGPGARGALVYWLAEQGIDESRAPPSIFGSGTTPYSPPVFSRGSFTPTRYPPFAEKTKKLFEKAAKRAGLPTSWAREDGLHQILDKESDGWVGIPNYTYRERSEDKTQWGSVPLICVAADYSVKRSAHEKILFDERWKPLKVFLGQLSLPQIRAHQ